MYAIATFTVLLLEHPKEFCYITAKKHLWRTLTILHYLKHTESYVIIEVYNYALRNYKTANELTYR